jgi:hypothetical protein
MLARFKRAGVGTNGILECKFLSENTHRAIARRIKRVGNTFPGQPYNIALGRWIHFADVSAALCDSVYD